MQSLISTPSIPLFLLGAWLLPDSGRVRSAHGDAIEPVEPIEHDGALRAGAASGSGATLGAPPAPRPDSPAPRPDSPPRRPDSGRPPPAGCACGLGDPRSPRTCSHRDRAPPARLAPDDPDRLDEEAQDDADDGDEGAAAVPELEEP